MHVVAMALYRIWKAGYISLSYRGQVDACDYQYV